jgi:outer membrane murein-binding lipoprotein Lpp
MKTTIALIIAAIVGTCIFIGCSTVGVGILSTIQSAPEEGWAKKAHLETLMNHSKKELLSEDEKKRAAKNICLLKHLDKGRTNQLFLKKAKVFCKLEKNDKIYFYDKCMECGGSVGLTGTSYLLVRDGKTYEAVQIEKRLNRELKKAVPIIERLH